MKYGSIALSYDQKSFVQSNDSIVAFNLKIMIEHRPVHHSDRYRPRPAFFYAHSRTTCHVTSFQFLSFFFLPFIVSFWVKEPRARGTPWSAMCLVLRFPIIFTFKAILILTRSPGSVTSFVSCKLCQGYAVSSLLRIRGIWGRIQRDTAFKGNTE